MGRTTPKYTPAEVRAAILAAAAAIEAEPKLLDIGMAASHHEGACPLVHIGAALGMSGEFTALDVMRAIGMPQRGVNDFALLRFARHVGRNTYKDGGGHFGGLEDPERCPGIMRSYADAKYPEGA